MRDGSIQVLMLLLLVSALSVVAKAGASDTEMKPPHGPLPTDIRPLHYRIDLTVLPEAERFSGKVEIEVDVSRSTERIWLHGRDLAVREASARNAGGERITARYAQVDSEGLAQLTLESPLAAGRAVLELSYDAPFTLRGINGLARLSEGGRHYVTSDCFPIDARSIFPGFDEPRLKATFDWTVRTRSDYAVISNSPESSTEPLPNGLKRVSFARSQPLPSYVLALSVGPYDVVSWAPVPASEVRKHALPLRAIAAAGKGNQLHYALENTAGIVRELESYFGLGYPFAKLDLVVPPEYDGAMENAAAISYGENYMLLEEQSSPVRKRAYAYVHAHELSHQWFGNLVTPAWWDDLWLNESFATWLANSTLHRWAPQRSFGRETLRMGLAAMDRDSLSSAREFRRPIRTSADLKGRLNPLIYDKGSAMLAMFEGFVGEEAFRRGVQLHMRRHAFGTVRADDFLQSLSDGAKDARIAAAFRSFTDQPGVPLIAMDWSCEANALQLDMVQSRYVPLGSRLPADRNWLLPVCVSYDADGTRAKHCVLMNESRSISRVPVKQCPLTVMPNAAGSGYYRFALPDARFDALMEQMRLLDPGEVLSLEDSVVAEVGAGRLEISRYLSAVPRFAAHPAWDVAVSPLPRLTQIIRHLLHPAEAERARAFARELYVPRLQAIGLTGDSSFDRSNPDEASLLRAALVPFVALEARDPATRAKLASVGRAYVGFGTDGKIRPDVADSTVAATALAVAAQESDRGFIEALWRQLQASTDMVLRRNILFALAHVTQPELANQVRSLILSPVLNESETGELFTRQAGVAENFNASWEWMQGNLPALVERTGSAYYHEAIVGVAAGFCDAPQREQVAVKLRPWAPKLKDGEWVLRNVLEQIELCAQWRQRHEPGARAFFGSHRP